jgi:hypothetical protein
MPDWSTIEREVPELAAEVMQRFAAGKHATLATLRRDGSPRISGTEVEFASGRVRLGSMPGAVKALDLRRDPRFALHSPTVDPPDDDPSAWPGEAKLAGRAHEITEPAEPADGAAPHRFELDITEVVLTRVRGDRLEIVWWHANHGLRRHTRA